MQIGRYLIAGMLIASLCACGLANTPDSPPASSASTASSTGIPISNSTVARKVQNIKQDAHTALTATRAAGAQIGKGLQQAGHDLQQATHKAEDAADNAAGNAKSSSSSGD
ncbi:MAG: hypothetical protein C4338_07395 [Rhodanobacteraceae bacterium]